MRRITRYLANVFYRPLLVKYLSKERLYSYRGIRIRIHPEVFHPGFFFSTKILLRCLRGMDLKGKTMLELGAGSGLIAITAARAGAAVTATDINPVAVDYLAKNSIQNEVPLTILQSDLFTAIPPQPFEVIVVNPPYYFGTPKSYKDHAWYCGKNGEYFHALFAGLSNYSNQITVIRMVLCEGSDRPRIGWIAGQYGFALSCIHEEVNLIERNYVYDIVRNQRENARV